MPFAGAGDWPKQLAVHSKYTKIRFLCFGYDQKYINCIYLDTKGTVGYFQKIKENAKISYIIVKFYILAEKLTNEKTVSQVMD